MLHTCMNLFATQLFLRKCYILKCVCTNFQKYKLCLCACMLIIFLCIWSMYVFTYLFLHLVNVCMIFFIC